METTLKQLIKDLSSEQVLLRDQRKSVYNKLERTITPYDAAMKHIANRQKLRGLYTVLTVLKGGDIKDAEITYGTKGVYNFQSLYNGWILPIVEKYKKEYEKAVCISE